MSQAQAHAHIPTHTKSLIKNELAVNGLPFPLLKNMEMMEAILGKRLSFKNGKVHSKFKKRKKEKTVAAEASAVTIT